MSAAHWIRFASTPTAKANHRVWCSHCIWWNVSCTFLMINYNKTWMGRFHFQNFHRSCLSCGTWDPLSRCADTQQSFDSPVCSYRTCTACAKVWSEASDGATAGLMQQKQLCGVVMLNISLLFFIQRQQGEGECACWKDKLEGIIGLLSLCMSDLSTALCLFQCADPP